MSEREAAREMLRELLQEALAGTNGHGAAPAVPPPPVAAVLRPSTWASEGEHVAIETDADLARFVYALIEDPARRDAIRAGRVTFALSRGAARGGGAPLAAAAPAAAGVIRIERGAVTERKVAEAAKAGARLVLGPGAVLTPLAREKARALGIEFERER
jgi:hypothetical protein